MFWTSNSFIFAWPLSHVEYQTQLGIPIWIRIIQESTLKGTDLVSLQYYSFTIIWKWEWLTADKCISTCVIAAVIIKLRYLAIKRQFTIHYQNTITRKLSWSEPNSLPNNMQYNDLYDVAQQLLSAREECRAEFFFISDWALMHIHVYYTVLD